MVNEPTWLVHLKPSTLAMMVSDLSDAVMDGDATPDDLWFCAEVYELLLAIVDMETAQKMIRADR